MMNSGIYSKIATVRDSLRSVIKGKDETLDGLLTAVLSGGHVLMDDVPGVGKTTLAKALAKAVDSTFSRIQFTPDLLPADILGSSIYNPRDMEFHFHEGPVFANIVLADEINRASPRTQSALLEAMSEKQISIEGKRFPLPKPFLVIATENPIEYYGTYPLPEAQLDRFAMQLQLGYPSEEAEYEMLCERRSEDPLDELKPQINCEELVQAQNEILSVEMEKTLELYLLSLIRATREDTRVKIGASPRSLLIFSRCAKAYAWLQRRAYVVPDDIKRLALPLLSHRVILDLRAKHAGSKSADVILEILEKLPVPR